MERQFNELQVKALVELQSHPGWTVLCDWVREYSSNMEGSLPGTLRSGASAEQIVMLQNFTLGQIVGMRFFLKQPGTLAQGMMEVWNAQGKK